MLFSVYIYEKSLKINFNKKRIGDKKGNVRIHSTVELEVE
jgi:hypothetical protein